MYKFDFNFTQGDFMLGPIKNKKLPNSIKLYRPHTVKLLGKVTMGFLESLFSSQLEFVFITCMMKPFGKRKPL